MQSQHYIYYQANLSLFLPRMKKYFLLIALLVAISVQAQDVIPMEKKGGVYKVPCKINGLALKFVFDTGASDVSISLTEALFMYKNDYLQESDFKGTEYYRIANGDIAEGTKVILKTVEIGKQKLYNVEASVVHSLEAPLLFGQSALQRFGKFTVDYSNNTLIIGGSNTATNTSPTAAKPTITQTTTASSSPTYGTVTDIDGNVYKTVKIGNQIWMAENLKTTRYANGDIIPNITDGKEWNNLKTGAWCFFKNETKYNSIYGKLYNWYAVADSRNICPKGWHVPTDNEFRILINKFGGEKKAGIYLKLEDFWDSSRSYDVTINKDSLSMFNVKRAGYRMPSDSSNSNYNLHFSDLFTSFWTTSLKSDEIIVKPIRVGFSEIWYTEASIRWYFPNAGLYCRCIKN